MFRKNSQERNSSAGARVASSKKLPSDFFTPSKKSPKPSQNNQLQPFSHEEKMRAAKRVSDSMLFTFNQNNSMKKLVLSEPTPKLTKKGSSILGKFPSMGLRIDRQNCELEQRQNRLMKASRNPGKKHLQLKQQ